MYYASQLDVKLKIYGNFLSVNTTKKFNNFEKKKLTNASQSLFLIVVFDPL